MTKLTLETVPGFLQTMDERLRNIEHSLNNKKQSSTIDSSKKSYNLLEAAKYCRMAEPTFRTYIYRRKVAGTKFGKAWLFLEADLDQFIANYRRPTADELKTKAFEKLTSKKGGGAE